MTKYKPNKRYINKVHLMKILGKGNKGNFFGKIDRIITFIIDDKGTKLKFGDEVTVMVNNATEKVLLAEVILEGEQFEPTE